MTSMSILARSILFAVAFLPIDSTWALGDEGTTASQKLRLLPNVFEQLRKTRIPDE